MAESKTFLLRKGRVLTPRSRMRYRLVRLKTGRTAGAYETGGLWTMLAFLAVRIVSLPFAIGFDYLAWPIARRTLGRGPWWVVELRFEGPDAEFVRVAEAANEGEAKAALERIADRHTGKGPRT